MSIGFFVTLFLGVIMAGLFVSFLRSPPAPSQRLSRVELKRQSLTNGFFRGARRGDSPRPLARVYSQLDMALLECKFIAEGIKFHTLFTQTNNVRSGLGFYGYNDIWLYVLSSQYQMARRIVWSHIQRGKKVTLSKWTRVRSAGEVLLFGWAALSSYKLPELLAPEQQRSPLT